MSSEKRTALVTGSSSGIGRAIAETLLEEGWSVVGVARDHTKGPKAHPAYVPLTFDLADLEHLSGHLKRVLKSHPEISAVVSNAGQSAMGAIEGFSSSQIRAAIDLNLVSHMLLARAVVPVMKRAGGGDLIFMGSESARQGAKRGAVYCAAKFGLRGLAQSLRAECANRGVRVTLVNPGLVRTPFFETLNFRPGPDPAHAIEAGDVARAVLGALNARPGTVIDEINLSPLQHVLTFGPHDPPEDSGS